MLDRSLSAPASTPPAATRALRAGALAALLALAGAASFALLSSAEGHRLLWLPSGIALAAVLAWGPRAWPAVALGGCAAVLVHGDGIAAALMVGAGGAIEALVAAALLRRGGVDTDFARVRDVLLLAAVVFGAASAGGAIEWAAVLLAGGSRDLATAWWACWLGRALGSLLLAPVALSVWPGRAHAPVRRVPELVLLFAGTGALSLAVFASMGDPSMFNPLPYGLFPLLLWAALRLGTREVAGLLLLAALLASWGTASGHGPFAAGSPIGRLTSLYLYLSVAAIAALALSGAVGERARSAAALGRSERQYRQLVETMNEGVIALDAQGRVRFVNDSFRRLAGAETDALLGRPLSALIPVADRGWPSGLETAGEGGETFESELLRPDGGRLSVSVSPRALRDDAERITGWLAVVADVSERRRTDDMLRWIARATAPLTGDAFFRELTRHMASAFGFRIAFITECVDFPTTRVRTLACWMHGADAPEEEFALAGQPCEATIRDGRVVHIPCGVEERFPADRGLGVQGYLGVPVLDSSGAQVIGHMAFFSESGMEAAVLANPLFQILTSRAAAELQRKHAEEQGRRHLDQLAQVSRALALGEMGSAIAHELNQPLAAIATYAQASRRLLEAGEAGPEVRRALERVGAQAERAGEILRRLRGFLAGSHANASRVDLGALVAEVAELARPEARQFQVELVVRREEALPAVGADAIQVQQVVLNLVRNAMEAVAGGEAALRRVAVSVGRADGGIAVRVRDSGPGVPPALAQRIFEPFFTTRADGTGIGLAISRTIAEAHGGRLVLEPADGGGACFTLWLPVREERDDHA